MINTGFKASDVWKDNDPALLKSQWGWDPKRWGFLAFTDKGRRNRLASKMQKPFIGLIYSTRNIPADQREMAGKVCGFYILSDQPVDRADYAVPSPQPDPNAGRWLHGLRPYSAFSFLPEDRKVAAALFGEFNEKNTWRSIGHHGREMDPKDIRLGGLRSLRVTEAALFKPWNDEPPTALEVRPCLPWTKAGPEQKNGYWVEPSDPNLRRSLYILRMVGDEEHFLNERPAGRWIVKIGLSYAPDRRLDALSASLPKGRFNWQRLHPDTIAPDEMPYSFAQAKSGEDDMKRYLGSISGSHLGGEFYAATSEEIKEAWRLGNETASAFKVES